MLDLLTFSFDRLVNFNSVLFGNVDSNDDVDIFVDGVLFASDQLISGANPAALNVQGTQISFGADQFGLGFFSTTDDFTVAALDVSAVPLPAGVLFGLTGLAGLAAVSRRKRAQT